MVSFKSSTASQGWSGVRGPISQDVQIAKLLLTWYKACLFGD